MQYNLLLDVLYENVGFVDLAQVLHRLLVVAVTVGDM